MSSSDPTVFCSLHINEHNQAVLRFGGHWAKQLTFTNSQARGGSRRGRSRGLGSRRRVGEGVMSDRLAMIKHTYTDRGLGCLLSEDDVRWLVREVEWLRLELASVSGQLTDVTRDHRELRAKLIDLVEEWSSAGSGLATSPYDADVLDTYTVVVRRIRKVLADRGNAIEQNREATP